MPVKKAFTLIEAIIVITIFSIVGVGIASSFISGMKIWDRARKVGFVRNNALITLEMIARQLRQSVNISQIKYWGEEDVFSFPVLSGNSIVEVKYEFDSSQKILYRRQTDLADILAKKEDNSKAIQILSAEEFSIKYRYFDKEMEEYEWIDEWNEKDGIFEAVRLQLKIEDNNFIKTIFLPIYRKIEKDELEPKL